MITYTDHDMRIFSAGGLEVLWPLKDLRYVAPPHDGQPARLRNLYDQPDRLTLADDFDLAALQALCPDLAKGNNGWSRSWKKVVSWFGAAVLSAVFLVGVAIPIIAEQVAANLPPSFEAKMGERAKEQIIKVLSLNGTDTGQSKICRGPGRADLDRLLGTLTDGDGGATAISVDVLDLDIENAFALPGGNILVFNGLLKSLEHPNELAGILAHEIAHTQYRHPTEIFIKEIGTFALIGLIFGDVTGGSALAGFGKVLIGSAYGRDAEREADTLGVKLMNTAGLDSAPLADFLQRLYAKQGTIEDLFSIVLTHPGSKERSDYVRKLSTGAGAALAPDAWQAVKDICD